MILRSLDLNRRNQPQLVPKYYHEGLDWTLQDGRGWARTEVPHPRGGSTIPESSTLRNLPKTRSLGSLGFCKSITTSWQSRLAAFFCLHNEIDFQIIGTHMTIATKIILLLQKGKLFESFNLRYPVHKLVHLILLWENICIVLFNWLL